MHTLLGCRGSPPFDNGHGFPGKPTLRGVNSASSGRRCSLLETDMTETLCTLWQTDEQRQRLVAEHLRQVRHIASRIYQHLPRHISYEDLVSAGVLGLIDAIEKFDPRKHVQLSSYAKYRIRGAILDSLREVDWGPRELRRQARRLHDTQARLRNELERDPTEPELAVSMGMELEDLQKLLNNIHMLEIGSGHVISSEHGKERNLCEIQPCGREDGPLAQFLRSEAEDLLLHALQELPPRERQVLTLYYFEDLTMKQVGTVLGIGESRVSQIHSSAVTQLRARMPDLRSSGSTLKHRAATAGQS